MSAALLSLTVIGYLISLRLALYGMLDEPCPKKQRVRVIGVGALAVLSIILGAQLEAI